jgi:phospholipid/cholesterol/gamma-HCH transport system substrate-binding protein
MNSSPSTIRVGVFVLLGVAALLAAVFLVGTQEGLFQHTFRVRAYFGSIEGIRPGSPVRLAGVDIGVVDMVEVSPVDNRVHLDLKLNTHARGFVKKDSYATIMPEGLVGSYYVDVTVGSRTGEPIEDGDIIQTKEATRLSQVLESTGEILENIQRASEELAQTLAAINKGRGTLGKLIASEDIYSQLQRLSNRADSGLTTQLENIERLSVSVRDVVQRADTLLTNANAVVTKVNEGSGTLGALVAERTLYDSLLLAVQNTVLATEEAKVGAGRFAENMEALKHNFLFKGYFEDRGYWDKADYEKELDAKIKELKAIEEKINAQMEELQRRKQVSPN